MKRTLFLILLIGLGNLAQAQPRKFQVNGAARGYFFSNTLGIDEAQDSVSTRKANYGHTLLDLGFSIFPNKETEVIGMFRIRNELGGFWGGGVSFDVRQLTLKGVAGNVLKYQLGDIDIKMTPYTLYNTQEEGVLNEGDVFALRRDIVHYDLFYTKNNTWRMQGAQANFGLEFTKGIQAIDFSGFITRQRQTDGILNPERLYGGGTLGIRQSKNLSFALNAVSIFDLTETIPDSIQYKNNVFTGQAEYFLPTQKDWRIGVKAESGMSNAQYINYQDERAPETISDWFYDAAVVMQNKNKGLSLTLGFKDIGSDFLSPGAQTRRLDFSKFPGLYQQFTNDRIGRPLSYADVISGNTENSYRISEQLLPYYAAYNNTNPYGLATPNRRGIYVHATRSDSVQFKESFVKAAFLTQSRGTGSLELKNFLLIEAGTDLYINDFFSWKRQLKLDVGVRYESTMRSGEPFEELNLSSTFIDAGLSYELVEKFDVLVGAKLWAVNGNEFTNERNIFNSIENFDVVNYDFSENTYAAGLRYRFNANNSVSAQYQLFDIKHKDDAFVDYSIAQYTFLFSLKF